MKSLIKHHPNRMKIFGLDDIIGGVVGGVGSIIAGNSLANAYKQATDKANNTLSQAYLTSSGLYQPYRDAGTAALNKLQSTVLNPQQFKLSDFYSDPGYQFTLQQGSSAVNNSAAAKGGLLSGNAVRAADQYTTGLANTTYGDAYNRYMQNRQENYNELAGLTGIGLNATNATSNANLGTASGISSNYLNGYTAAANANASGYIGGFNGAGTALSGLSSMYMNSGNPYSTLSTVKNLAAQGGPVPYASSDLRTMIGAY